MSIDVKKKLKRKNNRTYLAKDFNSFRSELLRYAKTYFPNQIQDFSEASLGGLLLDMAAMVGDTMTFYLDHQFNELNAYTAVESKNLIRHLRSAGIQISGASPASVYTTFFIKVYSEQLSDGSYAPKRSALPVILAGTQCESFNGVKFNLTEDLDFAKQDDGGNYDASYVVEDVNSDGSPASYIMTLEGLMVSGDESEDSFSIGTTHVPFREVSLKRSDVSDIMSVTDSDGNQYYEVESLSQDTVFKAVMNLNEDSDLVQSNLEVAPAPYRFVRIVDPNTRVTRVKFGSGDADSLDDDIIPDPSKLSLPLYGKTTFSRFSIDPNDLIKSRTLGISPKNTTIRIRYRSGGGLSHNVPASAIRKISNIKISFRRNPSMADATYVRSSLDVKNHDPARGGDSAPTLSELREKIPVARQQQSRIVSKQDLLARIYTLPAQFGRVYRAGISDNPENPLSSLLYVISRNRMGQLDITPDSLKKNIAKYLNEFRLISDAIDILDASVVNYYVKFGILCNPNVNKQATVQTAIARVKEILELRHFQIDQPILIDDIRNVIINTPGVISLIDLDIGPLAGTIENRIYSDTSFDFKTSTVRNMITGPQGSIFELRFPTNDIIGTAL